MKFEREKFYLGPGIEPGPLALRVSALSLPAMCSFIFGNRKKSDGASFGLYGGRSKISQWNCSRSKACVCRTVCRRAVSCNRTIPRESFPLQQHNLRSYRPAENEKHLTVGGTPNGHSHGHSYLLIYHVTRSDVQLHEEISTSRKLTYQLN